MQPSAAYLVDNEHAARKTNDCGDGGEGGGDRNGAFFKYSTLKRLRERSALGRRIKGKVEAT